MKDKKKIIGIPARKVMGVGKYIKNETLHNLEEAAELALKVIFDSYEVSTSNFDELLKKMKDKVDSRGTIKY